MEGFRFVDERENEELREVIPQQLEKVFIMAGNKS